MLLSILFIYIVPSGISTTLVSFFKSLNLAPADINVCGMLQLGFNPRELARIQKVAAKNFDKDIVRYINSDEASKIADIDLMHDALYFKDAAWVNPQQICKRLTTHENISIKTLTKVYSLLKNKDLFAIFSDENLIAKADIVIIANANEAQNLGIDLHLKTQSVRGQISIVEATNKSNQLKTIICSDGYLSPATNNQHCLGATFSVDNLESALDEEDHQANLFKLKSFSLALHENLKNNIKAGRVSFRCTSFDYFPLVGTLLDHTKLKASPPRLNAKAESLPWVNGLYINIAHGSRGFTSAPFCAELLAQTICQEPITMNIELAALMNPNRFALRKLGLKRLAKMTT